MKQLFPIISRSKLWISIGLVILIGWISLFIANMRLSIQFTGGIEMVVDAPEISGEVVDTVTTDLTAQGYTDFVATAWKKDAYSSLLIQTRLNDSAQIDGVTDILESTLISEWVIQSTDDVLELAIIGPSIGDYIKSSAQTALIVGIIFMAWYILVVFASMRRIISPAALWVITVITMIFDIALPAGAYGILMMINPAAQIDTVFIISLLTVMGYSVNDTIVIFDRIRENVLASTKQLEEETITLENLYETSLRQTMRRSIGTSISTLVVVVAMYLFGTGTLKTFAFTLGLWVVAGTYSSIFLAAPMAYLISGKTIAPEAIKPEITMPE